MDKSRKQAIGCMLGAAFFGLIALVSLIAEIDRTRAGEEASAQVIEVEQGHKSGHLVVRFTTADGQSVRVKIDKSEWGKLPEPGDRVKVRYVPGDHNNASKADRNVVGRFWMAGMLGTFALVFAYFAVCRLIGHTNKVIRFLLS
ncbi:DUF3592 domain-containing protein [Actinomadura madurae]|uniref:DUF3592 domain-containing protein n=1 Tax=Actinomadura madurae TaxID=1993 RepID=UPI0020D221E8|nr:DUF3592 domain-containing protein [Actinomadura madurae]MCP9952096.1 DUF3592 domain-containing protein [Actinomadura madurae]MCQ0017531.1 DUF3592 domain-containing protein [Actinomadura madurae]